MKEVEDTLAWNIIILIVAFFAADVFFGLIYLLVWFSIYDGYLEWIVGLIIFALLGLFGSMIAIMVFKIKKIIRIVRT